MIIKNTIGIWLILTLVILPFPYFLVQPFFNFSSDSISTYYIAGIVSLVSLSIAIIQRIFNLINQEKLTSFLYVSTAYLLSYFLLKYGIDKLLLRQFYTPEPNILFTPVGELSKDILFWTTMGTSKIYNVFMGLIEIIPGLLLLHSRTRVFGALCAFGVLLNVFMINAGFDISVKLLSLYLLIAALFLLQPALLKLFDFFFKQKSVSALNPPHLFFSATRLKRGIKAIAISLLLIDVILPYIEPKSIQELQIEASAGSYENQDLNEQFLSHSIKRIHIHSKGYLIVEDQLGKFHDYPISVIGNSIHVLKEHVSLNISTNEGIISWKKMKFKRIESKSIPVLKDYFNWTIEGMTKNQVNP